MQALEPKTIRFFHQVDDPHSHQMLCLLPALREAQGVQVDLRVVPPPTPEHDPEPERARLFLAQDAQEWARFYDVPRVGGQSLDPEAVRGAQSQCVALKGPEALERAVEICGALWRGEPLVPAAPVEQEVLRNQHALHRGGYYRGGSIFFEGEHYPGLARWTMLEHKLGAQAASTLTAKAAPEPPVRRSRPGVELSWFYSFRSPYSYLSVAQMRPLLERYDVKLRLRPVLPMVMRGMQVPFRKRLFLARDAKRIATLRGQAFGRLADPLGVGVERLLAVLELAEARGRTLDFVEAAGRAVWAEGIDVAADAGLFQVAEAAQITPEEVRACLKEDGWRARAEANQAELLARKLWGVPCFVLDDDYSTWGQDRLFMLEARLPLRPVP